MKICKQKVWATADGKLVEDGSADAHELVAIPGQAVPESVLQRFKDTDSFFKDSTEPSEAAEKKVVAPAEAPEPTHREDQKLHKREK